MKQTLRIYWKLLGVQIRSRMQYRVSFVTEIWGTGLIVLAEFGALALALQRFENIGGWTIGEVAFLYGLVEFAFGLMDMLFTGFDPRDFGLMVRRGTFDQLLLRPINITVQVLGSQIEVRRLGRISIGAAIFVLALARLEVAWTAVKLLYLPFVVLGMVCFFGGLFVVGATITFWTVESIEVMNILTYGGSYTISYPMHIYPDGLRRFFTYVVPAIFLNYFPALYFLDKPDPLGFPAWAPFVSPLVGAGMLAAALAFWRYGIRQYQSTGN